MKKKLALMCIAGMLALGVSACGGKTQTEGTTETATQAETGSDVVGTEENIEDASSTEKVSDREDYIALEDLEIDKYVKLADYKNMEVSAEKQTIEDTDIEYCINSFILSGTITNRAVAEGDLVDIDFVGKRDGVAFEGGSGKNYKLEIGSGQFIPGFEQGLVGVMPGDTVDLNLSFPDDYGPNPDLAGVEVVFTVTVNGIQSMAEYATVTEQDLADLGLEYKTKEELWEAGKKEAEELAEKSFEANAKDAIVDKLMEESEVLEIPDYIVDELAQNYNNYMKSVAQEYYGISLEEYVEFAMGMTFEDYNNQVNDMCKDAAKLYMIIESAARAEKIEITDEQIHKQADEEAVEYGYESGDELIESVGLSTYRMSMLQDKVLEQLVKEVKIEAVEEQEDVAPTQME